MMPGHKGLCLQACVTGKPFGKAVIVCSPIRSLLSYQKNHFLRIVQSRLLVMWHLTKMHC